MMLSTEEMCQVQAILGDHWGYRLQQHITTLQSERDALREALKYARRFLEANDVDLKFIDSTLFGPASVESECPRCGSHLQHITFPIGANLPYQSCDDAWHTASGEPARKP